MRLIQGENHIGYSKTIQKNVTYSILSTLQNNESYPRDYFRCQKRIKDAT